MTQCRTRRQEATTRRVDDEFDVFEVLGRGSSSTVMSAKRRSDGRRVALKSVQSEELALIKVAEREYDLLSGLDHPNIIRALDYFTPQSTHAVLVLELCTGKTLRDAVRGTKEGCLPEETACTLSRCLVLAVDYLHRRGIVHRDIKPQNAMVTEDLQELRLVDFNVASALESGLLTPTGTKSYAAPEVCNGGSPSQASDVWGVGICLHFAVSGKLPKWRARPSLNDLDPSVKDVTIPGLTTSATLCGQEWFAVSLACQTLVTHCLQLQEEDRPTPAMLLQAPWMQSVRPSGWERADDC